MRLEEKALRHLEESKVNDPQHDLVAISEVMAEFSIIQTKAKLEEAAERAMVDEYNLFSGYIDTSDTHFGEDHRYTVNKESITKTPLDKSINK